MNKNTAVVIGISVVIVLSIIGGLLVGYRFLKHERWQSNQIQEINNSLKTTMEENESLKLQIAEMQDSNTQAQHLLFDMQSKVNAIEHETDQLLRKVEYSDTDFNYLAIGNSITKHPILDYWWNEVGMAASTEDKDYVHIVAGFLTEQMGGCCFYAINYAEWEWQAYDRAETYKLLDPYLNYKLNLITVQLSENVSDTSTFEKDYEELIDHIKEYAPEAEILIIGDFWDQGEREQMKKEAANNCGVEYISLDDIKGDPEYKCGLGTVVYDEDGNEHIVEHEGVANHPGDKGMEFIANKIIEVIN